MRSLKAEQIVRKTCRMIAELLELKSCHFMGLSLSWFFLSHPMTGELKELTENLLTASNENNKKGDDIKELMKYEFK